ncbi:hypothetical protein KC349_g7194 [Hortaea werneckii]|nr:hypothetical protein KC349_g7194 [Hortaea werneckii]
MSSSASQESIPDVEEEYAPSSGPDSDEDIVVFPARRSAKSRNTFVELSDEIDENFETPATHEVECDEEGNNLLRLQEALASRPLGAVTGRRLDDVLSPTPKRSLHAKIFHWGGKSGGPMEQFLPESKAWVFALATDPEDLTEKVSSTHANIMDLRRTTTRKKHRQGVIMFTPLMKKDTGGRRYHIPPDATEVVMARFKDTMERVPVSLHNLSHGSIERLFVMSLLDVAPAFHVKIETEISLYVKNNACVGGYFELLHPMSFQSERLQWWFDLKHMDDSAYIPTPHPAFDVHLTAKTKTRLKENPGWEGVPEERRELAIRIGSYIASQLSFITADPKQALFYKFSQINRFRTAKPKSSKKDPRGTLAIIEGRTMKVKPAIEALSCVPWLTSIDTEKFAASYRHAVKEAVNTTWIVRHDMAAAWEAGCWVADMIRCYGNEVFVTGCMCDEEEAKAILHECASCDRLTICDHLRWVETLEVNGRVCVRCKQTLQSEERLVDYQAGILEDAVLKVRQVVESDVVRGSLPRSMAQVRRNLAVSLHREQKKSKRPAQGAAGAVGSEVREEYISRKEVTAAHLEALTGPLQSQFHRHAADDRESFWDDAYLNSRCLGFSKSKPMIVSVDAIDPLALSDHQIGIHVPGNLTYTKRYANSLKGSWPPIVLYLLFLLDKATEEEESREIIIRLDNLTLIRRQIPWLVHDRNNEATEDVVRDFYDQCRTGIPSQPACENRGTQDLWTILVAKPESAAECPTPMLPAVIGFIKDFEASDLSRSPLFRIDGVPYPFKGGPLPQQWSWPLVYAYFAVKLNILKYQCNRKFLTTITVPQLIAVVFYLLWLPEDADLNERKLLRLPVCFYTRTPLSASIGKTFHGRQMTSGLPANKEPVFSDFMPDSCNILVEPWLTNAGKKDWDTELDAIRRDFRSQLKIHNPPFWTAQLSPMSDFINSAFIVNAPTQISAPGENEQDPDDDQVFTGVNEADHHSHRISARSTSDSSEDTGEAQSVGWGRRNMSNIGQTCFMSTVIQALHKQDGIRDFVGNEANFRYVTRTGASYGLMIPAGIDRNALSDEQVDKHINSLLLKYKKVVVALGVLFDQLVPSEKPLGASFTRSILNRLNAVDSRWQNVSNESAQLYDFLIDILIRSSDRSLPAATSHTVSLAQQRHRDMLDGCQLPTLADESTDQWQAFKSDGHDSPLASSIMIQTLQEVLCPEAGCNAISRNWTHQSLLYLDFPTTIRHQDVFELFQLLDLWSEDRLHTDDSGGFTGLRCPKDAKHTAATTIKRRISRCPGIICFAIRRSSGPGQPLYLNHVGLPDIIDLGPYTSADGLPSYDLHGHSLSSVTNSVYRLRFINHYRDIGQHYIAYFDPSATQETAWVRFDDTQAKPSNTHPIEGSAEGEVVHFALYERQDPVSPSRPSSSIGIQSPFKSPRDVSSSPKEAASMAPTEPADVRLLHELQDVSGDEQIGFGPPSQPMSLSSPAWTDLERLNAKAFQRALGKGEKDEASAAPGDSSESPSKAVHSRPGTSDSTIRPATRRRRFSDTASGEMQDDIDPEQIPEGVAKPSSDTLSSGLELEKQRLQAEAEQYRQQMDDQLQQRLQSMQQDYSKRLDEAEQRAEQRILHEIEEEQKEHQDLKEQLGESHSELTKPSDDPKSSEKKPRKESKSRKKSDSHQTDFTEEEQSARIRLQNLMFEEHTVSSRLNSMKGELEAARKERDEMRRQTDSLRSKDQTSSSSVISVRPEDLIAQLRDQMQKLSPQSLADLIQQATMQFVSRTSEASQMQTSATTVATTNTQEPGQSATSPSIRITAGPPVAPVSHSDLHSTTSAVGGSGVFPSSTLSQMTAKAPGSAEVPIFIGSNPPASDDDSDDVEHHQGEPLRQVPSAAYTPSTYPRYSAHFMSLPVVSAAQSTPSITLPASLSGTTGTTPATVSGTGFPFSSDLQSSPAKRQPISGPGQSTTTAAVPQTPTTPANVSTQSGGFNLLGQPSSTSQHGVMRPPGRTPQTGQRRPYDMIRSPGVSPSREGGPESPLKRHFPSTTASSTPASPSLSTQRKGLDPKVPTQYGALQSHGAYQAALTSPPVSPTYFATPGGFIPYAAAPPPHGYKTQAPTTAPQTAPAVPSTAGSVEPPPTLRLPTSGPPPPAYNVPDSTTVSQAAPTVSSTVGSVAAAQPTSRLPVPVRSSERVEPPSGATNAPADPSQRGQGPSPRAQPSARPPPSGTSSGINTGSSQPAQEVLASAQPSTQPHPADSSSGTATGSIKRPHTAGGHGTATGPVQSRSTVPQGPQPPSSLAVRGSGYSSIRGSRPGARGTSANPLRGNFSSGGRTGRGARGARGNDRGGTI